MNPIRFGATVPPVTLPTNQDGLDANTLRAIQTRTDALWDNLEALPDDRVQINVGIEEAERHGSVSEKPNAHILKASIRIKNAKEKWLVPMAFLHKLESNPYGEAGANRLDSWFKTLEATARDLAAAHGIKETRPEAGR